MPFTYTLHPTTRLVVTVAAGQVTDADLLALFHAQSSDTRIPTRRREYVSLEKVTEPKVTSAGIGMLVDRDREQVARHESYRLAVVAPSDVAYGFSRMYQMLMEEALPECAVFRNHAEASEWLGLSADEMDFVREKLGA
ncbi:MAG: hypothetical protein M5U26_08590 [Planctomycetota bacterium]|nr:hypothetical protein [Planctomycetota bacterium]